MSALMHVEVSRGTFHHDGMGDGPMRALDVAGHAIVDRTKPTVGSATPRTPARIAGSIQSWTQKHDAARIAAR